ncbi:MAG: polysaccharide export protein [Desulfobacteraceae bacterium]|nr:polysaccharide export protein [Desulfobacteraceae bacterium]
MKYSKFNAIKVSLMSLLVLIFAVSFVVPGWADGESTAKRANRQYRVGVGDVLILSVWKDSNLTRSVIVLPDGTLSFPLVGRIQAEGRTLIAIKNEITKLLTKYIPAPTLSIEVSKVNSMVIYVDGKVNRPGRFEIADNINVLQALSLAGGLNAFAQKSDIRIFRETSSSGTKMYKFNYKSVVSGRNLENNIKLKRGDIIVVP